MAAILSGMQPSGSVLLPACRSCHSLQQQQQQSPLNVLCTSSQLCRQGVFSVGSVRKAELSQTRSHPQVLYISKPERLLRLRARASAEFQAESGEVVSGDAGEALGFPDTISSQDEISPELVLPGTEPGDTAGLPSQFEEAPRLEQEGTQAAESSSAIVTGDVPAEISSGDDVPDLVDGINSAFPAELSSGDDVPDLVDGINSAPSTSAPAGDVLQSSTEDGSSGEGILSIKERYLRLTQGNSQSAEQSQSQSQSQSETYDVGDTLKAAQESIDSARDAAVNSVEGLVNAVRDTVDSASNTVKNAYDSVNGSIVRVLQPGTTSDNAVTDLQSTVDNAPGAPIDFTSVFRVGTPANDTLKDIVVAVKSATGSALGVASNLLSQAYSTTKDNVPENAQSFLGVAEEKVSQVSGPVGSAIDQAFVIFTDLETAVGLNPDNPVIPVILVVGGSLFFGFGYLNGRYGGYAGDLQPSAALDLLKNERNVALIDIRPQATREAEGIPDLRRETRSKFAVVEVIQVEGAVRGMLRNVSDVEAALTAAVIGNLKNVQRGSKIILMDKDGGQSKQIARSLKKSGFKSAFLMDGGFKAWASSGLRSKAEGPQTPLLILQEDAEAIVEEVKPTPSGIFAVLLGAVAGAYAVVEWEKTLQLIGLVGLGTTAYRRVSSYESVEDAQADLRLLLKPFKVATQGIISIAGLVQPKTLQLATAPVSSNVQGRVIQAAAKHGPISSELELVEDEPSALAAVAEETGEDDGTQGQHINLKES